MAFAATLHKLRRFASTPSWEQRAFGGHSPRSDQLDRVAWL